MTSGARHAGRLAVVEDDPTMGESLVQGLELAGWQTEWYRTAASALAGIASARPDLVICDVRLPDMPGDEIYRILNDGTAPPFIFMTAFGAIEQAIGLVRAGAEDYLAKPFDMDVLFEKVRAVLERRLPARGGGALGISAAMREVEALLARLATRAMPVLLIGETGTGKEVCARFLHAASGRSGEPFMAVNCAAIPAELLESEVFGHERGAFSGAHQRHLGYAERARKGTLFLDEVGDMPLQLQAKMLRVVEERSFNRVGGEGAVPLQARLVCATNRDLAGEVRRGRFREDLFYRINGVQVDLPPLRTRPDDVSWLLGLFFEQAARQGGSDLRGISQQAEQAALDHPWPGNAREVRNRVERAVALAAGPWLAASDLFPCSRPSGSGSAPMLSLSAARDAAERRQIELALRESQGQIGVACRSLGIARTTLWEKMKRHGLSEADAGVRPEG